MLSTTSHQYVSAYPVWHPVRSNMLIFYELVALKCIELLKAHLPPPNGFDGYARVGQPFRAGLFANSLWYRGGSIKCSMVMCQKRLLARAWCSCTRPPIAYDTFAMKLYTPHRDKEDADQIIVHPNHDGMAQAASGIRRCKAYYHRMHKYLLLSVDSSCSQRFANAFPTVT